MDCSPPGSSIHGIFQARLLEWGAIAFSLKNSKDCPKFVLIQFIKWMRQQRRCLTDVRSQQYLSKYTGICFNSRRKKLWVYILNPQPSIDCVCVLSLFSVSNSLWPYGLYIARHAPLSMGFSRQEYWSELPCPPPGDLPHPGIEPVAPVVPALQADSLPQPLGKPSIDYILSQITSPLLHFTLLNPAFLNVYKWAGVWIDTVQWWAFVFVFLIPAAVALALSWVQSKFC